MKKLSLVIISLITILSLSACGKKVEPISLETFINLFTEKGYTVQEVTEQYNNDSRVDSIAVAINSDLTYQIEYFNLSSEEQAKGAFAANKETIESKTGTNVVRVDVETSKYQKYSETTDSAYRFVARVQDTVIYLDIDSTYKDEVVEILKEIGY